MYLNKGANEMETVDKRTKQRDDINVSLERLCDYLVNALIVMNPAHQTQEGYKYASKVLDDLASELQWTRQLIREIRTIDSSIKE
jgi:hypothetical protein